MVSDPELAVFTFYAVEHRAPIRVSLLDSHHFVDHELRSLWEAERWRQKDRIPKPLDIPTKILERVNTQDFVVSRYTVHDIERQMVAKYQMRETLRSLARVVDDLKSGEWTKPDQIFARVRTDISRFESEGIDFAPNLADKKNEVLRLARERTKSERQATIEMPLRGLNDALHGWVRGKLHLVGAVTSGYKTSFARMSAEAAAKNGRRVLFWTAEDSGIDLAYRSFAANTRAASNTFITGENLSNDLMLECAEDVSASYNQRIATLDAPRPKLSQLLARVRFEYYQNGLDMFVFDFMQLIAKDDFRQNENVFWVDCSNDLSALAKELDIVVLVTVQVTQEATKKQLQENMGWLTLGDLRGGSAIAQAAYGVILIQNFFSKAKEDRTATATRVMIHTAKWKSELRTTIDVIPDGAHDQLLEAHHG